MISRLPLKYLITICILTGIGVLELIYAAKAVEPPAMLRFDHATPLRRNIMQASAEPQAVLVASILARPLFSPTRRPAPVTPSSRRKAVPRLSGVIISGTKRLAIFAGPQGGKPIVAAEGDRVGNWVISLVQPDWVTLVGPGGSRRIQPMFASTPPLNSSPALASRPNTVTMAMAASHRALLKLLEGGR